MDNELKPQKARSIKTELIKWVNGSPIPVYSPPVDNQQIGAVARATLSLEYETKKIVKDDQEIIDPKEEKFEGCTNLEVMFMKAAQKAGEGDLESAEFVLNRVIGKPKQFSESVVINTTLAEALNTIAEQMAIDDAQDAITVTEIRPSVLD